MGYPENPGMDGQMSEHSAHGIPFPGFPGGAGAMLQVEVEVFPTDADGPPEVDTGELAATDGQVDKATADAQDPGGFDTREHLRGHFVLSKEQEESGLKIII